MNQTSSEYLKETSRDYSLYVCQDRAIPYATDGLKDVQRKALWLLRNKADKIKTVSLAGEMISSNLYVHGDVSAADAVSLLAAPYMNNVPLIEGIGSFGTRVAPKEGIGAPRYTYVKRSKITQELVYPDLDIVPLKENYDGSNVEPTTFLPIIPLLLLNGVSGIAVGWSTDILPRKPSEVIDACISALDGDEIPNIQPYFTYLDLVINAGESNKYVFTGKFKRIDSSTLKVCELPPDVSLERFKERLNQLEDDNVIRSYTDNSTKKIDIEIKFPRGSLTLDFESDQGDWTDDKLLDILKLRQKATERIVVIGWDGKSIQQYDSVSSYIRDFVKWRLSLYTNRYEKMKQDVEQNLVWLNCLKLCFDEQFSNRINSYKNKKEMVADAAKILKNVNNVTADIPERIVVLPGYRWTNESYGEVVNEIKAQEKTLKSYEKILNDENKLKLIYRGELVNLKITLQ